MLMLLIANLVVLPVAIAFFSEENSEEWAVFNCINDGIFILDILLNFRTGIPRQHMAVQVSVPCTPPLPSPPLPSPPLPSPPLLSPSHPLPYPPLPPTPLPSPPTHSPTLPSHPLPYPPLPSTLLTKTWRKLFMVTFLLLRWYFTSFLNDPSWKSGCHALIWPWSWRNMVKIMPWWRHGDHVSWHGRHDSWHDHDIITMFSMIHTIIMVWS